MIVRAALLLALLLPLAAEEPPEDVWVTFWNVENLFEPATSGAELEEGIRRPSKEDHQVKIRRIREVLRRVNWGRGPDVLGLAEVENERVVKEILTGLPGEYAIAFHPGHYRRKVNVALAVRKPLRLVGEPRFHHLPGPDGEPDRRRRTILQAEVGIGEERLHCFVVHLKSKYGGDGIPDDEKMRAEEARFIVGEVEKLKAPDVLVMGDFNEDQDDSFFRTEFGTVPAYRDKWGEYGKGERPRFVNLGPALQQSFPGGGTHYYDPFSRNASDQGRRRHPGWSILDSFLVSPGLLARPGLYTTPYDAWIAVSFDQLNHNAVPDGVARSKRNRRLYPTGVSDHLPVVLRLLR